MVNVQIAQQPEAKIELASKLMALHRTGRHACVVVGAHGERQSGVLVSEFSLLLVRLLRATLAGPMLSCWSRSFFQPYSSH